LDDQQAVVPGATVAVRNVDTNARRTTPADSSGRWRMYNLPPGNCEVTVELPGFATVVINSANFLNEKGTDGGNRRIWLSVRYVF